jgi:hypothetical protein
MEREVHDMENLMAAKCKRAERKKKDTSVSVG